MKKWEIECEEVEAVLDKIWDLHDKLSEEIHSISRTHFTKSLNYPQIVNNNNKHNFSHYDTRKSAFVFFKDSAIDEAKSLNSIRSALENLEDHLEFFHTIQIQQRAERDAAIARLEQSRIILALRLAEHSGKRYKVIDEAMNFVGDVKNASCFVEPVDHPIQQRGNNSNVLVRVLLSGLDSAKRTLQLDKTGGVIGNAVLFAFSMLALLHLQQVTFKDNEVFEIDLNQDITKKKLTLGDGSSSTGQLSQLDVRLGRG